MKVIVSVRKKPTTYLITFAGIKNICKLMRVEDTGTFCDWNGANCGDKCFANRCPMIKKNLDPIIV